MEQAEERVMIQCTNSTILVHQCHWKGHPFFTFFTLEESALM